MTRKCTEIPTYGSQKICKPAWHCILDTANTNINIIFRYNKTTSKDSTVIRAQITVIYEIDTLVGNLIRLVIFCSLLFLYLFQIVGFFSYF